MRIAAAFLADMLAQQLAGAGIEQAHEEVVPLHVDQPPNPSWWRAIVGGFDFHAAVQMHGALAVLVIAEGFEGQRSQRRFFFREHGGHLPLGGAVNARVRPVRLPTIQVGLGLLQTFEAQPFERRLLGMSDSRLDFSFSIGMLNPARHGHGAVVREHVAVEGIERGIVDVGDQHALA